MWPNPQETVDLVTFTDEILNEILHFWCSVPSIASIIGGTRLCCVLYAYVFEYFCDGCKYGYFQQAVFRNYKFDHLIQF